MVGICESISWLDPDTWHASVKWALEMHKKRWWYGVETKQNQYSTRPSRPVIGSLDLHYPPLQRPSLKCAIKIFELARIGDHRSIGDRGHSREDKPSPPYPSGGVFFKFFFLIGEPIESRIPQAK